MALGENLRLLRARAGISQRQLGKAAGVRQELLSALERGMQPPKRTDHVERIARALGVSVDVLTGPSVIRVPARRGDAA